MRGLEWGITLLQEMEKTMKEELGTWGAVVGMLILGLLFAGLALAIYPGWAIVGHFLDENIKLTKEAPAWVQAIGSVAAIAFSGWFAGEQIKAGRKASEHASDSARALAADLRRLDDLKRTEVIFAIVERSLVACNNVRRIHAEGKISRVTSKSLEYLLDSASSMERLPSFELPGSALAVAIVVLPMQLRFVHEAASIVRKASEQGYVTFHQHQELEKTINLCVEDLIVTMNSCSAQIEKLRKLSTGVEVVY